MVKLTHTPRTVVVTGFAGLARLPVMLVVFLVAGKAGKRRIAKTLQVFVAIDAFDLGLQVAVANHKTGFIVHKTPRGGFPVVVTMAR